MDRLGRYPLSVILSYLTETEGTSLLITKKRYAHQLLPIFRLKNDGFDDIVVSNAKNRHCFVVSPVQDPVVLLERLNTKRLFRRREAKEHGLSTKEMALKEWRQVVPTRPSDLELLRFVDSKSDLREGGTTILVSYPRSGNSLVRSLLERVTGIVTGSDTRPDRGLSRQLAEQHQLVGEGVTQSAFVPFVKTHWPERVGNGVFRTNRAILVVRNCYDAIDSYWNMNATKSHNKTLTQEVYRQFQEKFKGLVRNEIDVWLKFHKFWLNESPIPVLLVRYEDVVRNPNAEVRRMLAFSLGVEHLADRWCARVDQVTGKAVEQLGSYTPRTASGGASSVGKSIKSGHFSYELLSYIRMAAGTSEGTNYLQAFGYDELPEKLNEAGFSIVRDSSSSTMLINKGPTARPDDCPYGRALQQWRHSVTSNDQKPLATV